MKVFRFLSVIPIVMAVVLGVSSSVQAGLPFHTIEGVGGGAFTPKAYLVNQPAPGQVLGKPSFAMAYVGMSDKNLSALTLTEAVGERLEFGFAADRLGLGNLPAAIGSPVIQPDVWLYNFNLRAMFVKENTYFAGIAMPAITGGVHYKVNDGVRQVNDTLSGALTGIGYRSDSGTDFVLTATKTLPEAVMGKPLILTAGVRESKAAHIGLLGFGDTYRMTFEGSIAYMPNERILLMYEYRQKKYPYDTVPGLLLPEDDWHGFDCALLMTKRTGLCIGYGIFGNVLNTRADSVWWLELKHDF